MRDDRVALVIAIALYIAGAAFLVALIAWCIRGSV